ncbi:MAG TPA: hypothetical protein VEI25_00060, partial [Paraburkholderia sp.]|nr:hypothetical protein [Paraburkholderia sp.]
RKTVIMTALSGVGGTFSVCAPLPALNSIAVARTATAVGKTRLHRIAVPVHARLRFCLRVI